MLDNTIYDFGLPCGLHRLIFVMCKAQKMYRNSVGVGCWGPWSFWKYQANAEQTFLLGLVEHRHCGELLISKQVFLLWPRCNWKTVTASHFAKVFGSHKLNSFLLMNSKAILVTLFSKYHSLNIKLVIKKMQKRLDEWRISMILINR